MSERVECTVCGAEIGRGPKGLGLISHSLKHRREFEKLFGREPRDYAEVRATLGSSFPPQQATIWEAIDDDHKSIRETHHE